MANKRLIGKYDKEQYFKKYLERKQRAREFYKSETKIKIMRLNHHRTLTSYVIEKDDY